VTGNQPYKARAPGLKAIYCSGWQVAADANGAGQMVSRSEPLSRSTAFPNWSRRLNNSLARLDQIESLEGRGGPQWYLPIFADAEAGFGAATLTCLSNYEVHDSRRAPRRPTSRSTLVGTEVAAISPQVLIPTQEAIRHLVAARLAADGARRSTIIIAAHRRQRSAHHHERPSTRATPSSTGEPPPEDSTRCAGTRRGDRARLA